jgi:hypothetical protein
MRFYTQQHPFSCGIDLHARTMSLCLLDQAGETLLHRNMQAPPEALLKAIAPYRGQIVLAADCRFTWYWLADLGAEHELPFVLGSCPLYEGHPWRYSQKRPDRRPENRRPAAWWDAPAGLGLSGCDARNP